jgi:hypothetical protein
VSGNSKAAFTTQVTPNSRIRPGLTAGAALSKRHDVTSDTEVKGDFSLIGLQKQRTLLSPIHARIADGDRKMRTGKQTALFQRVNTCRRTSGIIYAGAPHVL